MKSAPEGFHFCRTDLLQESYTDIIFCMGQMASQDFAPLALDVANRLSQVGNT